MAPRLAGLRCQALYDNGYKHMLDPDHAPDHPDDPDVSCHYM